MIHRLARLFASIILIALLTACNSTDSPAPIKEKGDAVSGQDAKPAYGDMFISGTIGDASVLLPVLATDSSSGSINGIVYDGLCKYDEDIKIVPELAERWEISEDKLTVTFHLKKGVKWHDGQPFTARDVEFTYKVYIDPKTPTAYASPFMKVKELKVIDDYTIQVTYKKPYAPALESWGVGMLPRHLLEGKDITKSPLTRHPIGTGPYIFKEWETGEKIVLDANADYFEGRPYISRFMSRVIPDMATMFLELKAKRLDNMTLTPLQYSRQTDTKQFHEEFRKYKFVSFIYVYLGYNLQDWRFKDKRVRQALTTAMDREGIVQGVLLGLGSVLDSPYKPDSYWYNHNVKKFAYDPEKAKAMLAEAGWKDTDGDGIIEKDGKPFEFTIITNQGNKNREKAAVIIQRDLKRVGISVKIRVIEWAAFIKNFINKRNFEACLVGWSMTPDPDQIDIWNSEKVGPTQLNFVHYQNPEVDRLLELGVSTYDRAERKRYYDRFQEIIAEDQPYTFLFVPDSLPIVSARFHGIKPSPNGIFYNFIKWYVPKGMQRYEIAQ